MTRTTLDLDDTVLGELKERQKQEHKTLGQLASELLAKALRESERPVVDFVWNSSSMGMPLVDLEDKDAVWAVLDQR